MAEESEADRLGFVKEAASKEGVCFHDINSWEGQKWIDESSIVVLDIFGVSPLDYRPFLLSHQKQLQSVKKLILYHSHLQDE